MVFVTYFFRRFLFGFLTIAFVLAFLFNLIEFFEKLLRVANATVLSIVYFIVLNFFPTFFSLLPIASWLATCLLIREFWQQKEWDTLLMLNIDFYKLLKIFSVLGFLLMIMVAVINEHVILSLTARAEQFRHEVFKQTLTQRLTKKWYLLDEKVFCYIGLLDLGSQQGRDILLIYRDEKGMMSKTVTGARFNINQATHEITLMEGKIFLHKGNKVEEFKQLILNLPSLFLRLQMTIDNPSLVGLIKKLLIYREVMAYDARQELYYTIIQRLLFYFQILIYPALTFSLFALFELYGSMKWIMMLAPYPIITLFSVFGFFIFQKTLSLWGYGLVFLLVISIIGFAVWRKRVVI